MFALIIAKTKVLVNTLLTKKRNLFYSFGNRYAC